MTLERFSRIVDDPDLLRTITYEELKTLALAYPYAHNLRYFLAIKARQIDHPDVVKTVATAAAYSIDRTQLFKLVAPQMIAPQEVWIEEEVLELKPIETLKRKLEEELYSVQREDKATEAVQEAEINPEPAIDTPVAVLVPVDTPEEEESEPAVLPAIPYQTFSMWYAKFNLPLLGMIEPAGEVPVPEPVAEAAPDLHEMAEAPRVEPEKTVAEMEEIQEDEGDPPGRETPKTAGVAQALAERSVAENKDVISETLARLFAKQGYRDKAISMYERLRLAFPEKSAYFAAEIDKLKK